MLLALIPVLALAAPPVIEEWIAYDDQRALDDALSARLRTALAAGWTIVDVSGEDGERAMGFTLEKDGELARHVATFDDTYVYRVRPARLPLHPTPPSDRQLAAIRGGGGVELVGDCDGFTWRSYVVQAAAGGVEAHALVARSLAAADDLDGAWADDHHAVFELDTGGGPVDLVVTLAGDGVVAAAELRRYDWRRDLHTYRAREAMAHMLRGGFVSSIRVDGSRVIALGTSRGRFTIDPAGPAFLWDPEVGPYGRCEP